jgi:Tol biopolymer transport system component
MAERRPPSYLALVLALVVPHACGGEPGSDALPGSGAPEAQPTFPLDPDIWVAELTRDADGTLRVGAVREAIHRPGYDNQPHFTPDGTGFWFTALEEHTGQTDIWRYDLTGSIQQVTASVPESEYSATPMPDGTALAVVRVEADSTQRLWRIPLDGSEPQVLLPDLAPVGYQAWVAPGTVALFVLGEPPTLRIADVVTGEARIVAEGIGRSIRTVPGSQAVSFVRISADGVATLSRYDHDTGVVTPLVETVGNGEFHAWTPDGTVLMALGSTIYAWRPGDAAWLQVADLSQHNVRISRLAVRPDGAQIALVVEPGDVTL